ncbi:zinc finger protein 18-like isoform X2 [Coccinella septempunctata]|uniref:zinc finger protein 18-like isoform X2 n=1 Tax=Coccinella septempunctata TaxID=41139 RepID=UPI001D0979CF|nr:zinc finger protein 18-like isoform X2 [Coccinella septempunctata]
MSTYYCRLCFVSCKPEETLLFSQHVTDIIQFCIPENIKLVNNPVLCPECYNKLEQMLNFKKKCLEVQNHFEKIIANDGICDDEGLSDFIHKEETRLIPTNLEEGSQQMDDSLSVQEGTELPLNTHVPLSGKNCNPYVILSEPPFNPIKSITIKPNTTSKCKSSKKSKIVKNTVEVRFDKNSCKTCSLSLNSLNELIHHLYTNHQKNEELYSCLICRFKSKNTSLILQHYQNFHPHCKDLNASCFFCLTDKKTFKELNNHMTKKHNTHCKWGRYFCNSCDFVSRSFINFRKHYFQSHDLICNYCLRYCGTVSNLNRHLRKHLAR